MPVSNEISISGPYTPNGSTASFPFEFKAASASEVVAVDGEGNIISAALYSVELDDDEGGQLVFGVAPTAIQYPVLFVVSDPAMTQPSDFDNAGPSFNPAALTRAIDRAAIRDLKQQRELDRALKVPFGETASPFPSIEALKGKSPAVDLTGEWYASAGGGADAGLRPDLASQVGASLISGARAEASVFPWIMRDWLGQRVDALSWIPADIRADIAIQDNGIDLAPYIQAALDEAPIGCDLYFGPGDWRVYSTLTVRRQMNLIGNGMRLQGYFGADTTSNLIDINIEEAVLGNTDARGMVLREMRAYFSNGGHSVCVVDNVAPMGGNLGMMFEHCGFAAPDTGTGSALEFVGVDVQKHLVLGGHMTNRVKFAGCADGVKLFAVLIDGHKTGVHLDSAEGAFRQIVERCIIVSRDGQIAVYNGSQVDILHNQLEQFPGYGANQLPQKCQLLVYPQTYGSRSINIIGNNFGGGGNCEVPIELRGGAGAVDDTFIDLNTFNPGSTGLDWRILDAAVRGTKIGPNNKLRGSRGGVVIDGGGVASANTENSLDLMSFSDLGSWTYGVWKTGADLSLPGTTTANTGFRFKKTFDDIVIFEGSISTSDNSGGVLLATLPPGFRPKRQTYQFFAGAGGSTTLRFDTNGQILGVGVPATGEIWLSGFTLPVKGRVKYDPGV